MNVEILGRIFVFNSITLPDPNPAFTVEQVRDMYCSAYPELATAAVDGPETTKEGLKYSFKTSVGIKG
jgi:PRTRC genetic system protein C